jgi:hypothetical protein
LQDNRNKLAYSVKAELDDAALFKESFQNIVGLAKEVTTIKEYAFALIKSINELKKQITCQLLQQFRTL